MARFSRTLVPDEVVVDIALYTHGIEMIPAATWKVVLQLCLPLKDRKANSNINFEGNRCFLPVSRSV